MSEISLVLFDDDTSAGWEPFALTRPAGELRFGALLQRERAERVLGTRAAAHLCADHLLGFEEEGAPPVRARGDAPAEGARLFLSSRAVPDFGIDRSLLTPDSGTRPVHVGGEPAGWLVPAGEPPPRPEALANPASAGGDVEPIELPGRLLARVWQLVLETPDQLGRDIEAIAPEAAANLPDGVHRTGSHGVHLGEGARIEAGAFLDTTEGPIWLDSGTTVRTFTRLAGPAYVGTGSTVLGGTVEAVSVGPVCKVRGELAESVCLGYVNKAHDGHIGHAYLGRWVNLGAETTNSDLKNNYGSIRVWTPQGEVDTGEMKLGSLIGDHAKTGIGLLLNTGTVVGAGSNLFGAELPPKYVPPFSWGSGSELTDFRLDKFFEVAERAMARREVELTDGMRQQLQRAWDRSREGATA
jgi:UDP-N-acetylglucosamine diphosphorylase / glucose-1-phosphate thymidylyltransferase / UDP-N-acetylgalactosamine diphosphorylase / glucosamine-1-phosphate N-acetyltransferase / galactosamine-1-phosphate N-acetyltransferase